LSKQEETALIKSRIDRAVKYFNNENENKYKRFQRFLKIKHWPEGKENRDRITVPYIHSIIRTKLPSVYLKNPKWDISFKRKMDIMEPGNIKNAENVRNVMDYMPEEIGLEEEVKSTVLDTLAFGRGVVSIGFEFDYEEGENPKILVDRFFVNRLSYPTGCFIMDPVSNNGLKGARWCAEKITKPLKDIKEDKNFKNTKDLKPNAKFSDDILGEKKAGQEEEYLEYWMYWEKNRFGVVDKYKCIVADQETVIKEGVNPYAHGEFPYEELDQYEVPDYAFPIGDIEPLETQQQELDTVESILLNHVKKFIQKYKARKGQLDSKARDALVSPENTVIELEEMDDIMALENPAVNNSVPLATSTIKADMDNTSGVNDARRGAGNENDRKTATEVAVVESGARSRSDETLHIVERFMGRVGRKLLQTIQQYMTEEVYIRINGDGSSPEDWIGLTSEDIQGEYDINVVPESTTPINKEMEKKKALELYNILKNDPLVNPVWLLEYVVSAYGILDINRALKTPEEFAQEKEQALLEQGTQSMISGMGGEAGAPPEAPGQEQQEAVNPNTGNEPYNPMMVGQDVTE